MGNGHRYIVIFDPVRLDFPSVHSGGQRGGDRGYKVLEKVAP
jgi:hypothetical protein